MATTEREINASAVGAVKMAVMSSQKVDSHKPKSAAVIAELNAAVAKCKGALEWGQTPEVMHRAAEALYELGKGHHLTSNDKNARACFKEANGFLTGLWKELVEGRPEHAGFKGQRAAATLGDKIKLAWAESLIVQNELAKASERLSELDRKLPRSGDLRSELRKLQEEMKRRCASAHSDIELRKDQTTSEQAAPDRSKRLGKRREEREKQQQEEQRKRQRTQEEDDEVVCVGEASRAEREARVEVINVELPHPPAVAVGEAGPSSSPTAAEPPQPPQRSSAEASSGELAQLVDMGFEPDAARAALQSGASLKSAIEILSPARDSTPSLADDPPVPAPAPAPAPAVGEAGPSSSTSAAEPPQPLPQPSPIPAPAQPPVTAVSSTAQTQPQLVLHTMVEELKKLLGIGKKGFKQVIELACVHCAVDGEGKSLVECAEECLAVLGP